MLHGDGKAKELLYGLLTDEGINYDGQEMTQDLEGSRSY